MTRVLIVTRVRCVARVLVVRRVALVRGLSTGRHVRESPAMMSPMGAMIIIGSHGEFLRDDQ